MLSHRLNEKIRLIASFKAVWQSRISEQENCFTSQAYVRIGTENVYKSIIRICSFGFFREETTELADLRKAKRSPRLEKEISLPLATKQPKYFHSRTYSTTLLLRYNGAGVILSHCGPNIIDLDIAELNGRQ